MTHDWDSSQYGEAWAPIYDVVYAEGAGAGSTRSAIATLGNLAGEGPVLELAIGTGRLALPLAARGLDVHGIDASPAMLRALRAKAGSDRIRFHLGDFADVNVDGRFSLVFVACNTFFALPDRSAQARCFANVARHLKQDGRFVIEAFVPDLHSYDDRGERIWTRRKSGLTLHERALHHRDAQIIEGFTTIEGRPEIGELAVRIRYAWPDELDAMASEAGLLLESRWGDWQSAPFTDDSAFHISCWRRAAG